MDSNYKSIYVGNLIGAQSMVEKLKRLGIIAVLKNEAESARLAGFASSMLGEAEVFLHNDELEVAEKVLDA